MKKFIGRGTSAIAYIFRNVATFLLAIALFHLSVGLGTLGSMGKSSSLTILPDDASLRGEGPFVEPLSSPASENTMPRALRGLAKIIDGGLCHRCGSCIGICPTAVLGLDEDDYPAVENLSACTDCNLCVRVCPGDQFHFEEEHANWLGAEADLTNTHGTFNRALLAYSGRDGLRDEGTSGGLVTEILLSLLESNQIDGAVVVAAADEPLWKGKPVVARTPDEIRAAAKSKYAIAPTNQVFSEILDREGRYALVGLPCQIHGFVKAAQLDPRLAKRVVLTVGLFCHAAIEHDAFRIIWESLGEKAYKARRFVSRIGKHPGAPHIELDDGSLFPVYFGNKQGFRPSSMEMINVLYRLYTPHRCLTCFDALSEFADVSVGDPWMAPPADHINFKDGWSFALSRTARGARTLKSLEESGAIVVHEVADNEAYQCNHHMASEKRWRAFRVIETHRRQGKPIPEYGPHGMELPKHSGWQAVKTEGNMMSHICCFLPRWRASVLRFFLGNGGYALLWLNNKRRRVKVWVRDTIAAARRRVKKPKSQGMLSNE